MFRPRRRSKNSPVRRAALLAGSAPGPAIDIAPVWCCDRLERLRGCAGMPGAVMWMSGGGNWGSIPPAGRGSRRRGRLTSAISAAGTAEVWMRGVVGWWMWLAWLWLVGEDVVVEVGWGLRAERGAACRAPVPRSVCNMPDRCDMLSA